MSALTVSDRRLVHIDLARGRFRVHRDAYRSAEVFEAEKELIFSKCWLYLGHETELPGKGDFLTRRVAGRDLIFVRSREGVPGAFFNTCMHRGAQVCRERRGTTKSFSCVYHGWVYNTEGKLLSMNAKSGFPADVNADGALNLRRVPRLEHYRGFYFVNYDADAISLADYLADAKSFLDVMCDQAEGEIASRSRRACIRHQRELQVPVREQLRRLPPAADAHQLPRVSRRAEQPHRERECGVVPDKRVREERPRAWPRPWTRRPRVLGRIRTPGCPVDPGLGRGAEDARSTRPGRGSRRAMARSGPG